MFVSSKYKSNLLLLNMSDRFSENSDEKLFFIQKQFGIVKSIFKSNFSIIIKEVYKYSIVKIIELKK